MPVSYTHLDVYKRQTYEQANNLLEGIGSTMRVNDDELIDQDANGGQPYRLYLDAVSYTHLDVYKRQDQLYERSVQCGSEKRGFHYCKNYDG